MTTNEVAAAAGIGVTQANQALTNLWNSEIIQRSKSGGRNAKMGEKFRRWRMPPVAVVAEQSVSA